MIVFSFQGEFHTLASKAHFFKGRVTLSHGWIAIQPTIVNKRNALSTLKRFMAANSVAKRCVSSGGLKTKEIWVGLRSVPFSRTVYFLLRFSNWMPWTCYLTLSDQNKLEQPRKQKLLFLAWDCTTNTWLPRPNWIALFPWPDTLTRIRNHKK